jgi:hypothetical protein
MLHKRAVHLTSDVPVIYLGGTCSRARPVMQLCLQAIGAGSRRIALSTSAWFPLLIAAVIQRQGRAPLLAVLLACCCLIKAACTPHLQWRQVWQAAALAVLAAEARVLMLVSAAVHISRLQQPVRLTCSGARSDTQLPCRSTRVSCGKQCQGQCWLMLASQPCRPRQRRLLSTARGPRASRGSCSSCSCSRGYSGVRNTAGSESQLCLEVPVAQS